MKLYHASNFLFEFPSMEMIDNCKVPRSSKSLLGFYVAHDQKLISNLGQYLYEVTLFDGYTRHLWPLTRMIETYNQIGQFPNPDAAFRKIREDHKANGIDVVDIMEYDGRVGESAIVNLECIEYFKRIK